MEEDLREPLKRAEEALRARELDFQLIVDSIPAPVAVITPTGEVETLNQPCLEYFGKTLDELKGWASSDPVHPEDLPQVIEVLTHALETGETYEVESRHRRFDGVYRWFHVRGFPLKDIGGSILRWCVLLTDIDDRKRAEAQLAGEKRLLEMVASGSGLTDVLTELCKFVEDTAADCKCGIYLIDWSGPTFHTGAAPSMPARFNDALEGLTVEVSAGPCALAALTGAQVIAEDLEADLDWQQSLIRPLALGHGLRAQWSTPICSRDGSVLGTFAIFQDHPTSPTQVQQDLIAQVTHIASIAIERALADEALRSSERNLSLTINTIPTFISVSRPDGTVLSVNQAALDYHGITLQDVQKEDFRTRFFHPDDAERVREDRKEALKRSLQFEYETRALGKDGKYRWFLVRCNPLLDDQGRIDRWYATAFDIEDRKRAEAMLAGEKRLLEMVASGRALTEVLSELCKFVEDTGGDCKCGVYLINWRTATFRLGAAPSLPASFNTSVEGLTVTSDAGPCGLAALTKSQVLVTDIDADPRFQTATIRPLLLTHGIRSHWSTPIYSRDGEVLGTFAIFQDHPSTPTQLQLDLISQVTHIASIAIERALSEAALRQSETFLAEAQRLSRIGSFSWRVATNEITWSEQLYRIYEFEPGVPVTIDLIRTRVHPEDLTLYEKMVEQARNGAEDFEWQYRLLMPDQSIKYMHAVARATQNHDGQLEYVAAVQDITRRKLIEQELRRSEAFLAEGQHLARMGNFWWRVLSDQIIWSEPMYRIFEFEPDTTVTLELIASRIHPDDISSLHDMIERAHRGEDFEYDHRIVMPDGSVKYLQIIAHRTPDQYRGPEYIGAVQDVTQRRLAEEALSRARSELAHVSRAMSLGALTASIAHEVNQPLSGIITNASTCMRMLDAEPPNVDGARETTKRTIRDGRRAADVITRLRALFARKDIVAELVDLNEATREVIALSRSELERNGVITKTELAEQLPLITGDRVQLQQVIMNLLRNGSDAMIGIDDRPRELLFRTEIEDGDRVRVSVQDAGSGFTGQNLDQLFQSFYTTKQNGMGIGLSVSRSIIENHQGRLSATPNDGPGVTFSFSIPCVVDGPR